MARRARGYLATATFAAVTVSCASCAIIANLGDRTLAEPDGDGGGVDGTFDAIAFDAISPPDAGPPDDGATSDVVTPPFDAPPGCVVDNYKATLLESQIYLAVDVSGSMVTVLPSGATRYDAERGAVTAFVNDPLSASLNVAMGVHPEAVTDGGCDPTPYGTPPVPLGRVGAGTGAAIATRLAALAPNGNSPWSPMMQGALSFAQTSQQAFPARITAFVFMADSTPTACAMTTPELVAIVTPPANATPPIRTFSIGITDTPTDVSSFFAPIAAAGGTTSPFAPIPPTQATMLAALGSIRDEIACVTKLPVVGGKPADVGKGLVFLQTTAGQISTSAVANAGACAAAGDAWYPEATSDRIHLCPKACDRLLGEATASVYVATCRP